MAARIEHVIRCLEQAYRGQEVLASEPDALAERAILRLIDEAWAHAVAARDGQD